MPHTRTEVRALQHILRQRRRRAGAKAIAESRSRRAVHVASRELDVLVLEPLLVRLVAAGEIELHDAGLARELDRAQEPDRTRRVRSEVMVEGAEPRREHGAGRKRELTGRETTVDDERREHRPDGLVPVAVEKREQLADARIDERIRPTRASILPRLP